MLIPVPQQFAQVSRQFPGYFTDVTERGQRRVFSAKANFGLITESYRDPLGRYKLYNGDKAQWITQKDLIRVRRTKNTPAYYETKKVRTTVGRSSQQTA